MPRSSYRHFQTDHASDVCKPAHFPFAESVHECNTIGKQGIHPAIPFFDSFLFLNFQMKDTSNVRSN
jgi:hypothetical protein